MNKETEKEIIRISDRELLKALGYCEDNTLKYTNAVEATVRYFKKCWACQSANH